MESIKTVSGRKITFKVFLPMEREEEKTSSNASWTLCSVFIHCGFSFPFHLDAMIACLLWVSTYAIHAIHDTCKIVENARQRICSCYFQYGRYLSPSLWTKQKVRVFSYLFCCLFFWCLTVKIPKRCNVMASTFCPATSLNRLARVR